MTPIEEMVEVACYAGSRYPERPLRVTWRRVQRLVVEVERQWLEPGKHCFLVRLEGDLSLTLCYDVANDRWTCLSPGRPSRR
ncbi:MAG: hypothetical protein Q8P22_02620 [Chloroflexota bacterium]|nr:hypothetical protein [Chloroflexota bacterium]